MPKEAFYFSHDSNARTDEKILKLRFKHGWKGYGIYWALVEMLRDASNYQLELDYGLLAYEIRCDQDILNSIIHEFKLFEITETHFYSASLKRRMELKDEKSEKAKQAANKRWAKQKQSGANANAMQTQSGANANALQTQCNKRKKERKKENKEIILNQKNIPNKSNQLDNDASQNDSVLPNLDFTQNDFKDEESLKAWRDWLEYNYHQHRPVNKVRQPLVKAELKKLATINGKPHEPTMRAIIKKCISMDWKNLQLTEDMKVELNKFKQSGKLH